MNKPYCILLNIKTYAIQYTLHFIDITVFIKSMISYHLTRSLGIKEAAEVSTWKGIPSVITIPKKEILDFNFWRKSLYVGNTFSAIRKHKPLMQLQECRVETLPDEKLLSWFSNTPLARACHFETDPIDSKVIVCDLSVCRQFKTDSGTYLEGPIIRITKSGKPLSIEFRDNVVVYPNDGSHWTLAKLHLQACAPYYIAGYLHGDIHFGLPCVVAKHTNDLPKESILYQLLAPHIRFTLHINNEALRIKRASDKSKPYAPFPVTGDEFINGIVSCLNKFLLEPGFQAPHRILDDDWSNYAKFSRSYYNVIRNYISRISEHIDPIEYKIFAEKISLDIKGFDRYSLIDTLATFIWQVSVQHSVEHEQVYEQMELERYQSVTIRLGMPSESIPKTLSDTELLKRCITPEDRYRTVIFAHTFVLGHKHPCWKNSMDNIKYDFENPKLQSMVKKFQEEMLEIDNNEMNYNPAYVPIGKLIQSICW